MKGETLRMKRLWITVSILAAVTLVCTAAVLILLTGCGKLSLKNAEPRYATDYPLGINESRSRVNRFWTITKRVDGKKGTYLDISTNHIGGNESEYSYEVYDTEKQARAAFEEWYKASKRRDSYGEKEEPNWFKGEMPYVDDATINAMFYLEGNVIIIAELSFFSEWNGSSKDYRYREAYVKEHASELKDFALGMVIAPEKH